MQIYVSDKSPFTCARNLDDITLVKALYDAMRLISTAAALSGKGEGLCIPTGFETGPVRWLRNDDNNFYWTIAYGYSLLAEYRERFNRVHYSENQLDLVMERFPYTAPDVKQFLNNAIGFTHIQDVPTAYRLRLDSDWNFQLREHLKNKRLRKPTWTNVGPPKWWTLEGVL